MGRIRTVKPELFSHEELYEAEIESGLPLRIAYVGLFTVADREGRFKWRPRTLKLAVLPYDEVDFSRVLDALMTRGFIVKYANETGEFGYIPSFSKHQVINNRESASDLPDPKECPGKSVTSTREPRVNDASTTPLVHAQGEGKGREGNKEGKEKTPVGQKPDDATGKSESETVEKVFAYWQQTMNSPKSVLDKKRRDVIKRALQSYSPRDLCLAIKGCSRRSSTASTSVCATRIKSTASLARARPHRSRERRRRRLKQWSQRTPVSAMRWRRLWASLLARRRMTA
jgi:hypothetical protein